MIFMVEALFITWKGNPFRLLIQQQGEGEMRRIREFSIKKNRRDNGKKIVDKKLLYKDLDSVLLLGSLLALQFCALQHNLII
jgi:hypothetical protein